MQILLYVLLVSAIAGFGYGVVHTYNTAITRAEQAEQQKTEALRANQGLALELAREQMQLEANRRERAALEQEYRESREENQKLTTLFQEHEFDKLYAAKPGLILNRVNAATGRVFERAAEIINGAGGTADPVPEPPGD